MLVLYTRHEETYEVDLVTRCGMLMLYIFEDGDRRITKYYTADENESLYDIAIEAVENYRANLEESRRRMKTRAAINELQARIDEFERQKQILEGAL